MPWLDLSSVNSLRYTYERHHRREIDAELSHVMRQSERLVLSIKHKLDIIRGKNDLRRNGLPKSTVRGLRDVQSKIFIFISFPDVQ